MREETRYILAGAGFVFAGALGIQASTAETLPASGVFASYAAAGLFFIAAGACFVEARRRS